MPEIAFEKSQFVHFDVMSETGSGNNADVESRNVTEGCFLLLLLLNVCWMHVYVVGGECVLGGELSKAPLNLAPLPKNTV